MKGILQIVGPPAVGKTLICDLLLNELSKTPSLSDNTHTPLLIIDASANTDTQDDAETQSLVQLAADFQNDLSLSQEQVDWAFSELIETAGPQIDRLNVGILPTALASGAEKMLAYGLNRLFDHYDYVLIDGRHSRLYKLIKHKELVRLIMLASPSTFNLNLDAFETFQTPSLIINHCHPNSADASLESEFETQINEAISNGDYRLIGRLPFCDSPADEKQVTLAERFQDCLLRLNLPLDQEILS